MIREGCLALVPLLTSAMGCSFINSTATFADDATPPDAAMLDAFDAGRDAGPDVAMDAGADASFDADASVSDAPSLDAPDGGPPLPIIFAGLGRGHSCAASVERRAHCWGSNSDGQVGGSSVGGTVTRPSAVRGPGGVGLLEVPLSIEAADNVSCAVLTDGRVACWGRGGNRLGRATAGGPFPDFVVDEARTGVLTGALEVDVGESEACARIATSMVSRVVCWGANQLGMTFAYPRVVSSPTAGPLDGVADLSVGDGQNCAVLTDGRVACWGANYQGQLGDGTTTTTESSVYVRMPDGTTMLGGAAEVTCGGQHSCVRLADGTAYCWGNNDAGEVGSGATSDRVLLPARVVGPGAGLLDRVTSIAAGRGHTCAVADEEVYCWGTNANGQLGSGDMTGSARAIPVTGLPARAIRVAAGGDHSCGALDDGSLWCWGEGMSGELGDGAATRSLVPVRVVFP